MNLFKKGIDKQADKLFPIVLLERDIMLDKKYLDEISDLINQANKEKLPERKILLAKQLAEKVVNQTIKSSNLPKKEKKAQKNPWVRFELTKDSGTLGYYYDGRIFFNEYAINDFATTKEWTAIINTAIHETVHLIQDQLGKEDFILHKIFQERYSDNDNDEENELVERLYQWTDFALTDSFNNIKKQSQFQERLNNEIKRREKQFKGSPTVVNLITESLDKLKEKFDYASYVKKGCVGYMESDVEKEAYQEGTYYTSQIKKEVESRIGDDSFTKKEEEDTYESIIEDYKFLSTDETSNFYKFIEYLTPSEIVDVISFMEERKKSIIKGMKEEYADKELKDTSIINKIEGTTNSVFAVTNKAILSDYLLFLKKKNIDNKIVFDALYDKNFVSYLIKNREFLKRPETNIYRCLMKDNNDKELKKQMDEHSAFWCGVSYFDIKDHKQMAEKIAYLKMSETDIRGLLASLLSNMSYIMEEIKPKIVKNIYMPSIYLNLYNKAKNKEIEDINGFYLTLEGYKGAATKLYGENFVKKMEKSDIYKEIIENTAELKKQKLEITEEGLKINREYFEKLVDLAREG